MADKLPEKPSLGDLVHAAGRGAIGSVPLPWGAGVLRDVAVELFGQFVVPPLQKRQVEFVNDLAERVQRLEESGHELPLKGSEDFAAFVYGAVQLASATVEREKLEMLRNAALNFAMGKLDQAEYFRRLIDTLSVAHVLVLRFLDTARSGGRIRPYYFQEDVAKACIAEHPEFAGKQELAGALAQDLLDRGLLQFHRVPPAALGPTDTELYRLSGSRLSWLGRGFLNFVSEPTLSSGT